MLIKGDSVFKRDTNAYLTFTMTNIEVILAFEHTEEGDKNPE